MAEASKGMCRNTSFPNEEDHSESHFQTDKTNALESDVQIPQTRGTVYNIRRSPRLNSEKKEIQCDENKMALVRYSNVKDDTSSVPSFAFHVSSEEGINLIVDLSSNPSDLITRLENEVRISQNLQNNNFSSFRQELECLGNRNKQMKSSPIKNTNSEIGVNSHFLQAESSSNLKNMEIGDVGVYQPDKEDMSLGFSSAKPGLESSNKSEDQNLRLVNKSCGNIALNNLCSLENACVVHSGCSAIGPSNYDTSNTVRNAEIVSGGLAEVTPASSERWEKENPVDVIVISDDSSIEKKDIVSGGTRKRKRSGKEIVDSEGRVLRSAKRFGGKGYPRRSMRLVE